jgi:hypothetical protein
MRVSDWVLYLTLTFLSSQITGVLGSSSNNNSNIYIQVRESSDTHTQIQFIKNRTLELPRKRNSLSRLSSSVSS